MTKESLTYLPCRRPKNIVPINVFKEAVLKEYVTDSDGVGYIMFNDDYFCYRPKVYPSNLESILKEFPDIQNILWFGK